MLENVFDETLMYNKQSVEWNFSTDCGSLYAQQKKMNFKDCKIAYFTVPTEFIVRTALYFRFFFYFLLILTFLEFPFKNLAHFTSKIQQNKFDGSQSQHAQILSCCS